MDDAPGGLLRKIITLLETAGIPHMVVGSFESRAHGEPRMTRGLIWSSTCVPTSWTSSQRA